MKKILTVMAVGLLIVAAAWPSFAATGRGHKSMRSTGCESMAARKCLPPDLNLTADQLTKMEELRIAHFKDVKPLHDKLFSLRGDLKLLWLEKNPDPAKINAVQKEIRALRDQMEDKRTAHFLEALKILTPEQQIKFKAFLAHEDFGPGGPGGPRPGMGHGPCEPRP